VWIGEKASILRGVDIGDGSVIGAHCVVTRDIPPFSIAAGIAHLRELPEGNLAEAFRYIRNAPLGTRTPLRRALACDPWWRGLRPSAPGTKLGT
jgi:carbonic anhydrase/acetyltransferase-like protein (isoleucine patch superfamily)